MDAQNTTKLNKLLKAWPHGVVAVHSWLRGQGISRDLVKSYVRWSWLNRVGVGGYSRADSSVRWWGGLYSVQQHLHLPIHVGGLTAMQTLGHAHYLPMKKEIVHLFGPRNVNLPSWFKNHDWGITLHHHSTSVFPLGDPVLLVEKKQEDFSVMVSSLELAMLEYLFLAHGEGYEEARSLMEGLVSLRPAIVQHLLEKCRSVKSKRLFLALADRCQHDWMKALDFSKITLGHGKRVFYQGGSLHPRFQITLPTETESGRG